ncbi:MAG: hypothetical protein V8Q54_04545 [Alistipes senegalensis]
MATTLTYDLHALVKGLKFQSYVGLNLFNMTRIGKNPDYTAVIYDPATEATIKTPHEGTQVSGKSSMGKWTHQGLFLHEAELRLPERRPPRRRVGGLLAGIGRALGQRGPRTDAVAHRHLRLRFPRRSTSSRPS